MIPRFFHEAGQGRDMVCAWALFNAPTTHTQRPLPIGTSLPYPCGAFAIPTPPPTAWLLFRGCPGWNLVDWPTPSHHPRPHPLPPTPAAFLFILPAVFSLSPTLWHAQFWRAYLCGCSCAVPTCVELPTHYPYYTLSLQNKGELLQTPQPPPGFTSTYTVGQLLPQLLYSPCQPVALPYSQPNSPNTFPPYLLRAFRHWFGCFLVLIGKTDGYLLCITILWFCNYLQFCSRS